MKHTTKENIPMFLPFLFAILLFTWVIAPKQRVLANNQTEITYDFTGDEASVPGYAQGSLTLQVNKGGTYYLYWADDTKALDGYYAIGDIDDTTTNDSSHDITKKQAYFHNMKDKESRTFQFEEHTAIPAGATKIIATTSKTNVTVRDAVAVFDIPKAKQLHSGSGKLLYTFNSYSDIHIDTEGYYQKSKSNWAKALNYASKKDTDFIISAGDAITNSQGASNTKGGFADEWDTYEKILASSPYCNPVYEANGNHDMRTEAKGKLESGDTYKGLTAFVKTSGTDSTVANVEANKPYYYVIEKSTGDVFIFMALENGSDPGNYDNFSKEQMTWLKHLLDTYYGTGVNVYIIEHSPFRGYGAGDAWMPSLDNGYTPSHYKSLMLVNGQVGKDNSNKYFTASKMDRNTEFQKLLEKYPKLIWMNGHTHQDFTVCTNYSNEKDTSCHSIHNPSVAGTTYFTDVNAESQEYDKTTSSSDGYGRTSQGYYVETYENAVIYYGANLYDEKIYPAYCYIMDGSRNTTSNPTKSLKPKDETLICDKELIPSNAELSSALTVTKSILDTYYSLSSYDQYQKLKKHYYTYKESTAISDTSSAVANLKEAAEQFYALAKRLGKTDEHISSDAYYLVYYVENTHAWTTTDCKLTKDSKSNLSYTYVATGSETASFKIYNKSTKKYHAVSESTDLTYPFSQGTYSLAEFTSYSSSSGARSITLRGMTKGTKVTFTYQPTIHCLSIFPEETAATPTVTPTSTPAVTTASPTVTPTNTPAVTTAPPTVTPTNTPVITIAPTNTPATPTKVPTNTPAAPTNTPTNTPAVPTKAPANTPAATKKPAAKNIQKGSVLSHTASNGTYRVLTIKKKADKKGISGTVSYVCPIKKNRTSVTIPAKVTIKKRVFQVTTIAANAFAGNKKLKKLVIGANIKKINTNALKGCKKLSDITIHTTLLTKTSFGKNAFKSIHVKATIKVPGTKLKQYKKFIRTAGASKTVIFKKKPK